MRLIGRRFAILRFLRWEFGNPAVWVGHRALRGQCLSRPCVALEISHKKLLLGMRMFQEPWALTHGSFGFFFWDWKDIPSSHTPLVRMESDNDSKHIPENHHSLHPFHSFPYLPLSPKPKQRPQKKIRSQGAERASHLAAKRTAKSYEPCSHVKSCPKIQVYPYDSYVKAYHIHTNPPQKKKTCCIN